MPGPAAGPQPHPGDALLGGLDQVDAPVLAQRQREAADLPDRLGAPLEQVGPVLDQPLRPVRAARLLVGDEREHDVARRHHPVPLEARGRRRASSRPCPSCRPRRGPTRSRPGPPRRTGAPTTRSASAGTTSRWPCTSSAPRSGSAPASRQNTLSRPGAPDSSTLELDTRPRRASRRRTRPPPAPPSSCRLAGVGGVDPDELASTARRPRPRRRALVMRIFLPPGSGGGWPDGSAILAAAPWSEWRNGRRASLRC